MLISKAFHCISKHTEHSLMHSSSYPGYSCLFSHFAECYCTASTSVVTRVVWFPWMGIRFQTYGVCQHNRVLITSPSAFIPTSPNQ